MSETSEPKHGFDTLQIHAGSQPDPATGARQTPIYQTTSYVFRDADHAAKLFNLQELGYIYTRIGNPTVQVLQDRVCALEGGAGAVACASGHAAQVMALFPLMKPGDNFVASTRLYGGSVNQFNHAFKHFGWEVRFVDTEDEAAVKAAIDGNTRAVFCESIANPGGYITDIEALAAIAHDAGVPLIVDNTTATPYLCRPFEHGADIVLHSTTKYLCGNATSMGGMVVDSGRFDWSASGNYPALTTPCESYHGLNFHEALGGMAYTFYSIAITLRDLGMCQAPVNAFQTLLGIETLSLRMERHCSNALKVAEFLESHPAVEYVTYAGLASSPWAARKAKYCPKGASSIFTFGVKGGYDACVRMVDSVTLFSHLANLGDARSLIIHSASTTHRQLTDEQRVAAGAGPEVVRLSIGLEDPADLIADLDQALAKATAGTAAA
ncbi:O-acetylhomoserine aminocarboxypropyltransferase/cysteine synthase [Paralimibaculum aggregatum]|uniref:O-acetylhomoserine aminocarboxypropyltransferase/cysteine synthase n=1 Tax=Paralimibaculum aggregatum TaxID=3036245 RepID=A0ABQ6LN58_9RHOB|nr:O-acetylhomoserine aminocarboxypropyltransferase [Limibaculum sp. NKW23]GMG84432.1 O-acetylhomoserine aminocarboxypropyltransferase/cysteine synthase [Limibaculum sp. NKW23]